MTARAEQWKPPTNTGVEAVRAGQWWDAVRMASDLGTPVLELLGDRSGAVIEDTNSRLMYWLVRPGANAGRWPHRQVQVLTETPAMLSYVGVPGTARSGPGPCWRVPPDGAYLTDTVELEAAVVAVLLARHEVLREVR